MRTRAARSNAAFVAHPAGAGYLDRGPARNLGSPLETLVVRDGYEDAGDCFDSSLPYGRTGRCLAVFYRRRRRRCLQLHIRLSRQGRDSLGLCEGLQPDQTAVSEHSRCSASLVLCRWSQYLRRSDAPGRQVRRACYHAARLLGPRPSGTTTPLGLSMASLIAISGLRRYLKRGACSLARQIVHSLRRQIAMSDATTTTRVANATLKHICCASLVCGCEYMRIV